MAFKLYHIGSTVGVFVEPVAAGSYYRIYARYSDDPASRVYDSELSEGLIYAGEPFGRRFTASGDLTINVLYYSGPDPSTDYAGAMGAQTVDTADDPEPCGVICDGSDWLFAVPLICDGSAYVPHLPHVIAGGTWKG